MSEIIKFTQEELDNIKQLQSEYQKKIQQFGELKFAEVEIQKQITELNKREEELKTEYLELQKREQIMSDELTKKYGDGVLNVETGEFTKQ